MDDTRVRSYKDLRVWKKAVELAVRCYADSENFPRHEMVGLRGQLRQAAVSVSTNIAEGHGRYYTREFIKFASTAGGALAGLETHLIIARRLGYLDDKKTDELLNEAAEVRRMLSGLLKSLRERRDASSDRTSSRPTP